MKYRLPARLAGTILAAWLTAAAATPPRVPALPALPGWPAVSTTVVLTPNWGLPAAQAQIMTELGLAGVDRSTVRHGAAKIMIEAYRFGDNDGAYGAFTYFRPADALPFDSGQAHELAAVSGNVVWFTRGVWMVRIQAGALTPEATTAVQALAAALGATAGNDPPPELPFYLPRIGLIANSIHFVEGPVGFAQACAWLPAPQVGFNLGAQAAIGQYCGGATVVLFSYPTPQIARTYFTALQKVAGVDQVRRTGTFVIAVHGASASQRTELLQAVNYDANLTLMPPSPVGIGALPALIIGIFLLIAFLIGVAVALGLVTGAGRVVLQRYWPGRFPRLQPQGLIRLNLK